MPGNSTAWCYTTDADTLWEYCDVGTVSTQCTSSTTAVGTTTTSTPPPSEQGCECKETWAYSSTIYEGCDPRQPDYETPWCYVVSNTGSCELELTWMACVPRACAAADLTAAKAAESECPAGSTKCCNNSNTIYSGYQDLPDGCVPTHWVNDGVVDCEDGSDESADDNTLSIETCCVLESDDDNVAAELDSIAMDCTANHPDLIAGNDACCTPDNQCISEEGDCDSDTDCLGSLQCGNDNCVWGDGDDCCGACTGSSQCSTTEFCWGSYCFDTTNTGVCDRYNGASTTDGWAWELLLLHDPNFMCDGAATTATFTPTTTATTTPTKPTTTTTLTTATLFQTFFAVSIIDLPLFFIGEYLVRFRDCLKQLGGFL